MALYAVSATNAARCRNVCAVSAAEHTSACVPLGDALQCNPAAMCNAAADLWGVIKPDICSAQAPHLLTPHMVAVHSLSSNATSV